eukprot:Transcript_4751.p3 GENE.Transcript_4751~~Transcript_4751.p3  ORF type:complete len:180 (+),score=69.86 Transcript_4751:638-1177(+)
MGGREDPEPPDGEWTSEGFTSSDNKPLPSLTRRRASAAAPPAATGAAASCSDDDAADAAPPAPKGRLLRLPLLHRYAHPAPRPCATVARLRDALAEELGVDRARLGGLSHQGELLGDGPRPLAECSVRCGGLLELLMCGQELARASAPSNEVAIGKARKKPSKADLKKRRCTRDDEEDP